MYIYIYIYILILNIGRCYFLCFGYAARLIESSVPSQGLNPGPSSESMSPNNLTTTQDMLLIKKKWVN